MPFTPYHLGPGLLIGLIFFPFLYIPAMILGSVIVDFEPLVFLLLGQSYPHRFFHTFLGASLAALFLSLLIFLFRKYLGALMTFFRLPQNTSPPKIILTTLLAANIHILLDAFLYPEVQPFWPMLGNPFLGLVSLATVELFCILCFIGAIPVFIFQVWRIQRQSKK